MKEIGTLQEWQKLRPLADVHTVTRELTGEIISAYQTYVRNRHICRSCPSAVWAALTDVKEFINRNRAKWDAVQAEQDVKDYRSGSDWSL